MAPGEVDYIDYTLDTAAESHHSLDCDRSRGGMEGGKYRELAITQYKWSLNADSCSQVANHLTGRPIKKGNDCWKRGTGEKLGLGGGKLPCHRVRNEWIHKWREQNSFYNFDSFNKGTVLIGNGCWEKKWVQTVSFLSPIRNCSPNHSWSRFLVTEYQLIKHGK